MTGHCLLFISNGIILIPGFPTWIPPDSNSRPFPTAVTIPAADEEPHPQLPLIPVMCNISKVWFGFAVQSWFTAWTEEDPSDTSSTPRKAISAASASPGGCGTKTAKHTQPFLTSTKSHLLFCISLTVSIWELGNISIPSLAGNGLTE